MLEIFLSFIGSLGTAFGAIWFIAVPYLLHTLFRSLWGRFVIIEHVVKQNDLLLEIVPPREIEASPKNMEGFFDFLTGTDKGPDIIQQYVQGYINPVFSCEIESRGGEIHFYIRTPKHFREFVESALYAAYPGAQLIEVEDYTWKTVPRVAPNNEWMLWGCDYELQKHDVFPIRTYKKFEEDITGKMIDPLNGLLEHMSSLPPGQHMWLQYIIMPERPKWINQIGPEQVDIFLGRQEQVTGNRLVKDIKDVIGGVFTGWSKPVEYSPWEEGASGEEQPVEFRLTPGEKQQLTALEENMAKAFFVVKMRMIVIGKRDGFSKANVSAMNGGTMKQFNDNLHNSLLIEPISKTDSEYLSKDDIIPMRARKLLERYRDRDGTGALFHFSTEELATVFHMPDMSVVSPGVQFVDAQRSNAPSNLPFMEP